MTDLEDRPEFKKLEAESKRREAEARRILATMDALHESLDPRGWTSQKGQALLDLLYKAVTQAVADHAEMQGQLAELSLRLSLVTRGRHLSDKERERRRDVKLTNLRRVVDARKAHPELSVSGLGALLGYTEGAMSARLSQARAEGLL
ncbi:MAG: hypothetical protein WC565_08480 [Parcubacteria group bacterium]